MTLEKFLDHKTMFYDKIDYTIIKKSWDILEKHIDIPYVIHIIGTNGKGSTGRFLASFLTQLGFDTLHYSSPHIEKFNERIWINGENSTDQELEFAHEKLQKLLPQEYIDKLTYFEYTTLLGLLLSDKKDYLVLEAGLGGEFDATNVVKNNLTLLTTIGLDHQNFLGDTIEKITATKVRSCDENVIVGYQQEKEVLGFVKKTLLSKNIFSIDDFELDTEFYNNKLPHYLLNNLRLSLSAMRFLNLKVKDFVLPLLFGRFQKISENITIDVGHNPLAANVILNELKKENKKVELIYNSYKDKDINRVLTILKPVIEQVHIIKCEDERIIKKEELEKIINNLHIKCKDFDIISMNNNKNYLVFGSFLVVENFLKVYNIER